MVRNTAREIAIHLSYELNFTDLTPEELLRQHLSPENFTALAEEDPLYRELPNPKQSEYIRRLVTGVAEHRSELDGYIETYAVGWKFARIPMVAAAIMRVAMFEILYMDDIPNGVAINEAVELAKKYGAEEDYQFVNGLLGSVARESGLADADDGAPQEEPAQP